MAPTRTSEQMHVRRAAASAVVALLALLSQLARCDDRASDDEEIIRTPQRVLEGIEQADLLGATEIRDESQWDYIGRLVPSVFTDFPTLCNLVYVDFAIYMAPMKCLVGVDTKIVGIRHLNFLLYVEVAILPDTEVSPNYFDDVALLVAKATSELYNETRRQRSHAKLTRLQRTAEDNYGWITKLEGRPFYQLISFVDVGLNLAKRYRQFTRLYKADNVTFSIAACYRALHEDLNDLVPHERAPCALLCAAICDRRFLYTLGSLLLDDTNTVIGVSSWQDNIDNRYMTTKRTHPPIGVAIPNKSYFDKNFKCALKIRDHHWLKSDSEPLKYFRDYALYDKLCTEKFKRSRAPIII